MLKSTMLLPYLDDFFLYLKTNNYSLETLYNYERDLTVFARFLASSSLAFEHLNKRSLAEFKAYFTSRDRQTPLKNQEGELLAARSLNRLLSALRRFLKFLIEMDLPCPLPPEAVKLVKIEKRSPRVAEFSDLTRLIESPTVFEKNPLVGLRNRAVLELLFATGMRISELCYLNRTDIDGTGKIFILGKGKKERFVYLTPRAQTWLGRYLSTRRDPAPALFIPYAGLNVASRQKRLSPNYLQSKIKSYREKLHINVPTSAHSLRHGFATYLAEKGASPAAIQILLGHESLDTTTRYVHASDKFAQQTHQKYHPLFNISK